MLSCIACLKLYCLHVCSFLPQLLQWFHKSLLRVTTPVKTSFKAHCAVRNDKIRNARAARICINFLKKSSNSVLQCNSPWPWAYQNPQRVVAGFGAASELPVKAEAFNRQIHKRAKSWPSLDGCFMCFFGDFKISTMPHFWHTTSVS